MASVWTRQLELEVKVVRVAGVEVARLDEGGLFVRYYVPAGDGRRRLRVDTREVPCGGEEGAGDSFWGELACFESRGGGAVAPSVGGVVFELRWRPRRRPSAGGGMAFLGIGTGRPSSRLLARGELACHTISTTTPALSSGTWLRLSPASRELGGGCKAPKLLVEVRMIHAPSAENYGAPKTRPLGGADHCCSDGERCDQCGWIGTEEDMFLAATFTHA
ncbi:hypothetical protein GUJ93_ZPchr0014g46575 [Zizania palustris]|uniref:Uncharacterized protein n=1 Tax=Zizania palustris TaxID=103762 RepID=A0A8J5TH92_ZIZPA|nr:hypothetical protein GUJ93_ZPchr0014g46575 [Zizania palustris]